MTERLAEIHGRIEGVHQLGAVVNAMRGIAAARVQQAREQLGAVDGYAQTISVAIGRALELAGEGKDESGSRPSRPARMARVVFVAEQGFAGAFSEHLLEQAALDRAAGALFLIGSRGTSVAAARGIMSDWQAALPAHPGGVPELADRIAGALFARIAQGAIDGVELVFAAWEPGASLQFQRRSLFPLDSRVFPRPSEADSPLTTMPPGRLVAELTEDYVHALLCHAALHAFVAENQARMEAMAAARQQVERQLGLMEASERRVRQDEITAEIMELAMPSRDEGMRR